MNRLANSCCFLMLGLVTQVNAAPPDAGSLQQQFRRPPDQLPGVQAQPAPAPAERLPTEGPTLEVKSFRFSGNTLFSEGQLQAAIVDYLGRPLDFTGLKQAAAAIGEVYRKAGWLARVYVPQQEFIDGVITLQIIESRFGTLRQTGTPPSRFDAATAEGYVAAVQTTGELLNITRIDRALLLLDDLPGVSVVGNLTPGEGEAETDLLLQMGDEALFSGQVALDNQGSRSVGRNRINAEFFLKSPLKRGDQLRGSLSHSKGNDYGWINYSLPVGYNGLRLGVNASLLEYDCNPPGN